MNWKKSILSIITLCPGMLWAQSSNHNYIREELPTMPIKNENVLDGLSYTGKKEKIIYLDGIGRPEQVLDRHALPAARNLIQHTTYDEFGNTPKQFLPYSGGLNNGGAQGYFDNNATSNAETFYQTQPRVAQSLYPYGETRYEASPLNRVLEQSAPGLHWKMGSGHTVSYQYSHSITATEVRHFIPGLGSYIAPGFYAPNTLSKKVTTDEHGNSIYEYTNKKGRLLKKTVVNTKTVIKDGKPTVESDNLETYYIFNLKDELVYVLPPKACSLMNAMSNWNVGYINSLQDLVYQYTYDHRGRMVEKKIPGAAPIYYLYDKRNQLVLMQDGNQRTNAQWSFYKYDTQGRVILEGIYTNPNPSSDKPTASNAVNGITQFGESEGGNVFGYTNAVFPTSHTEVQKRYYYDDYDFDGNLSVDATYTAPPNNNFNSNASRRTHGLLTKSAVKVLDGANNWIETVQFYDEKSRVIQVQKSNYPNGQDVYFSAYSFTGQVLFDHTRHTLNSTTHNIAKRYTYDPSGRLVNSYMAIDNEAEVLISNQVYNLMGQLMEKNLHRNKQPNHANIPASDFYLQSIDYAYNIRGWLTHINNCDLSNDQGGWGTGSGGYNYSTIVDRITASIHVDEKEKGGTIKLNILDDKLLVNGAYDANGKYEAVASSREFKHVVHKGENEILFNEYATKMATPMTMAFPELKDPANHNAQTITGLAKTKIGNAMTLIGLNHTDARKKLEEVFVAYVTNAIQQAVFNNDLTDLWGSCIQYNNPESNLNIAAQYNGNISAVLWKSKGNNIKKAYGYTYDKLNRLTAANYGEFTGSGASWNASNHYSVGNISYDVNGNILTLARQGYLTTSTPGFGMMDQLTYVYDGNRLRKVTDAAPHPTNDNDFRDLANGATEYTYDDNGNMTADQNKNITVSYNQLNLPKKVTVDQGYHDIRYVYDADGNKLRKQTFNTNTLANTTLYEGEFQYLDNALQFIQTSEGRAVKDNGKWRYEYNINDHLGNLRAAFSDLNNDGKITASTELLQETNYYPFGLEHRYTSPPTQIGPKNKYTYNSKELQDEFNLGWLSYGARFYDPQLGRFHTKDRFSEKYINLSNYQYGANNPILYIDVNGDSLWITHRGNKVLYNNGKLYDSKGNLYKGKGVKLDKEGNIVKYKGFLGKVTNALGIIGSAKDGSDLINELQGSKNNFNIVKGKNEFTQDNTYTAYADLFKSSGKTYEMLKSIGTNFSGGSGGTISWNPRGKKIPLVGGPQSNSAMDLAHEMFHALDANNGQMNDEKFKGIYKNEWQAVYRENLLRKQLNQPLRTHYITVETYVGEVLGGKGPRMLTPSNQIIKPKWYKR